MPRPATLPPYCTPLLVAFIVFALLKTNFDFHTHKKRAKSLATQGKWQAHVEWLFDSVCVGLCVCSMCVWERGCMCVRVCACFDKLFNKSYLEGGFNFKLITAIYPAYERKQSEGRL